MNAAEVLALAIHEYALVNGRINKLLESWDDARLAEQPAGQVNHPAWTIGHLCTVMNNGCVMVGGSNALDESWTTKYGGGSKPTTNRSDFPGKAALLQQYNALTRRFVEQLRVAPASVLATENPRERARARFPLTGQLIMHMLTAEPGYHLGQLTGWGRAMGWPVTQ